MKTIKILSLTMFIVLLTACSKVSEGDADHDKLQIVATYSIIADMTENIVGRRLKFTVWYPSEQIRICTIHYPRIQVRFLAQI